MPLRRHPVRYTLWLARTGSAPRTLSMPVWIPLVILGILAGWSGLNFWLWNRTAEMRNLQIQVMGMQEQARKLNNQLAAERTKLDGERTRNNALSEDAQGILKQLQTLETEINALRRRAGMPEIKLTPSSNQGGARGGGDNKAVELETVLAYAQTELKGFRRDLGEVSPELNQTLEREAATPYGYPVRGHGRITSNFGYRRSPFGWSFEFHNGLDFPAPYGTPVRTTGNGVIEAAGYRPIFGLAVVVDHGFGYKSLYGHLSSVRVRVGQQVERGQVIGGIGSTGRSTGAHLHYTIFREGDEVNPRGYLQ
jgi:murein DD-endopeptidase MepM/ murein hydrolase activator NlpD